MTKGTRTLKTQFISIRLAKIDKQTLSGNKCKKETICLMEIILRTAKIEEATLPQGLFQDSGRFFVQPNSLGGCEQYLVGMRRNLISSR